MEPVVERVPHLNGWRIRSQDQRPDTGMVVTDNWLQQYGFSKPTKFNIEKIIAATMATSRGYTIGRVDLDREARIFGDPRRGNGSAEGIDIGEQVGRFK
jgi:hypothetical protein